MSEGGVVERKIGCQQLRSSAALLLEWLRICLRQGWVGRRGRKAGGVGYRSRGMLKSVEELRGRIFSLRNKATFHYPGRTADRPVGQALRTMGGALGVVRVGKIREARAFFADDVVAGIFVREDADCIALDPY